jgi:transposase-like protein
MLLGAKKVANRASSELKAYAVAEYQKGRSSPDIGRQIGHTPSQICKWLKRAGVPAHCFDPNTAAYIQTEYARGQTASAIASELKLAESTVFRWIHKGNVPIHPSPRFNPNVVVPSDSAWKFIEHQGKDPRRRNQRVALFECTTPLPNGSRCGNRRTLVISTVTSGKTHGCHSCGARRRPRKALKTCGYEWKQRNGVLNREDRDNYNNANRDRQRAWSRAYKATIYGRAYTMWKQAQASVATNVKGLPFDLDVPFLEDLLKPGRCNVTGIPFDTSPPRIEHRPNMFVASLDRIVPSDGYIKGNVQVVVYVYNRLKDDHPQEDILAFIRVAYENMFGQSDATVAVPLLGMG